MVPIQIPIKTGLRCNPSMTLRCPWIFRALTSLKRVIMTKVLKIMVKCWVGGACTLVAKAVPSSMPNKSGPENISWDYNLLIFWKSENSCSTFTSFLAFHSPNNPKELSLLKVIRKNKQKQNRNADTFRAFFFIKNLTQNLKIMMTIMTLYHAAYRELAYSSGLKKSCDTQLPFVVSVIQLLNTGMCELWLYVGLNCDCMGIWLVMIFGVGMNVWCCCWLLLCYAGFYNWF